MKKLLLTLILLNIWIAQGQELNIDLSKKKLLTFYEFNLKYPQTRRIITNIIDAVNNKLDYSYDKYMTQFEGIYDHSWYERNSRIKIDLSESKRLDVGPAVAPLIDCWEFAELQCYLYYQIYSSRYEKRPMYIMGGQNVDPSKEGHWWNIIMLDNDEYIVFDIMNEYAKDKYYSKAEKWVKYVYTRKQIIRKLY